MGTTGGERGSPWRAFGPVVAIWLLVLVSACAPTAEPSGGEQAPAAPARHAAVPAHWPVPVIEVIDLFQPDTRFYQQSAKGSVSFDGNEFLFGVGSLRLDVSGSEGQLNLRTDLVEPLDLSRSDLVLWLRVTGLADLATASVYVGSRDMATYAVYPVAVGGGGENERYSFEGEWYPITIALGSPRVTSGQVDLSRVASIQLSVAATSDAEVVVHVNGLATTARAQRGAVTIMFDDARDSVYHLALPVLDELGLTATVSAIADLAGVPSFMTVTQLRELQDDHGWEIVAHHSSALDEEHAFDALSEADLIAELTGVRAWMAGQGLMSGIDAISYPHGGIDADALAVVRRYFDRGRTLVRGVGLETRPPADPLRLRAYAVRDSDPHEELLDLVDRAAASGGWLILVFHQLSDGAPAFQTSYRLDDFRVVMEHVATSGLEVVGLGH